MTWAKLIMMNWSETTQKARPTRFIIILLLLSLSNKLNCWLTTPPKIAAYCNPVKNAKKKRKIRDIGFLSTFLRMRPTNSLYWVQNDTLKPDYYCLFLK